MKNKLLPVTVTILSAFFGSLAADARPTSQEAAAFFAEQKKEKRQFELSILEETDPKAAAALKFNEKAKSDRIDFIRSLAGLPPEEKRQRLLEFNRSALDNKKDFEKKLASIPPTKNPKIGDLIKKRKKFDKDRGQAVHDFFGS